MNSPAEILALTIHSGEVKVRRPLIEKMVLGFVGGAMISMGYLLYIRVIASVAEEWGSFASFIGASVFPIGLIAILLGGGELITSNMAAVTTSWLAKKVSFTDLLKNWVIITIFNVIGAIFVAFVFGHLVGLTAVGDFKVELLNLAHAKVGASWYQAILSGIGCNWFVGLAMWLCYGAKDAAGKVLAIWFPVMAFVAIGFQHSIANAFLLPAAVFEHGITWAQCAANFGLVYIGNIIGGAVFVAGIYTLGYKREMDELKK